MINDWVGKRYRNIFIQEGLANAETVKHSQASFPLNLVDPAATGSGSRTDDQDISDEEIATEMPRGAAGWIRQRNVRVHLVC